MRIRLCDYKGQMDALKSGGKGDSLVNNPPVRSSAGRFGSFHQCGLDASFESGLLIYCATVINVSNN